MKTTFISTQAITEATRRSILKLQTDLVGAQKELATGRLQDIGLAIGQNTGQVVSLRHEHSRLKTIIETNAVVDTRLESTQDLLARVVEMGQDFVGAALTARAGDNPASVAQTQSKAFIADLTDILNASLDGAYLFAGTNTDLKPLTDYYATPTPANRQAVADAFLAQFGFAQTDPAAEAISAADMETFLSGPYAALFDSANWSADWSVASDESIRSRISTNELLETSATANAAGLRKLASALVMVSDLGLDNLNRSAYEGLLDKAVEIASEAIGEIAALQSKLGTTQERVVKANDRMSVQINIIESNISLLEGVDAFEASTRVTSLETQIETSYALTARIRQLSLLNYL